MIAWDLVLVTGSLFLLFICLYIIEVTKYNKNIENRLDSLNDDFALSLLLFLAFVFFFFMVVFLIRPFIKFIFIK